MQIIYRPDGGAEQTWEFEPNDLLDVEATAIERVTGWTYAEFGGKFMTGSILAEKALLWVLRRRTEPQLQFRDVSFRVREFEWVLNAEERRQALENLPELDSDAEREAVLKFLGPQPDDQPEDERPKDSPPAKSSAASTKGRSRTS